MGGNIEEISVALRNPIQERLSRAGVDLHFRIPRDKV
jgi:hypothetical protein